MTTPFGMPTFVKVGKKKTPKQLGAPGSVRPPTSSGNPGTVRSDPSTSDSVSTTEQELNMPGTFVAGDLLVFVGAIRNQGVDPDINTPAGWSVLLDDGDVNNPWGVCFYKVADGTETDTTYTHNNAVAVQGGAGVTFAVQPPTGIDAWSLAGASLYDHTTATTDVNFNAVPISTSGEYLIVGAFIGINDTGNADITDFGGMTEIGNTPTGNNDAKVTVASETAELSANYTPSTWTSDQSDDYHFGYAFRVFAGNTAPVAAGDHTHTEADVTDLDHWTETDHDALDHTGLTGVGGDVTVKKSGTTIGTRSAINFIPGTDITITTADDAGNDEVDVTIASTASGGGGSSVGNVQESVDAAPGTPDAMDDEFNDGSLAGKWTTLNLGTASTAESENSFRLESLPSADQWRGIYQSTPSGDWKFRAKVWQPHDLVSNMYNGIFAAQSTTGSVRWVGWFGGGIRALFHNTPTSSAGSWAGGQTTYANYAYVELEWDDTAGVLYGRLSFTGVDTDFRDYVSVTTGYTPAIVGVGGASRGTNGKVIVVDWFRRVA